MKDTMTAGRKLMAKVHQAAIGIPVTGRAFKSKTLPTTVLIGGHFTREVRRTLLLVQAEPENAGKNLKQLLGEAINDLCAKYGKPQPYSGEAD
jgi:hypothetical protein